MAHRCSYCGKKGHKSPTCSERKTERATMSESKLKKLDGVWGSGGAAPSGRKSSVKSLVSKKKKISSPWEIAEAVMPFVTRCLLYGPPGTGKTTAGNFVASEGIEVYNVTLTEEMPAAELRGHYVPKGGEFVWSDGPAMLAYRNGGRLVLNEIDRGSADALIFCYALLDDPGISRITLPTGEHVRPHENFTVVATTNGDPTDLPEALADRFNVRIYIDKPHPNAMKSLPDDLRKAAGNSVSGADSSRVSFRQWKAFAELRGLVGEDVAAKAVFSERATAIMDTIKLSRVKLHRPEGEEDVMPVERKPGEVSTSFRVGDRVRVKDSYGSHPSSEWHDHMFVVTSITPDRGRGVFLCGDMSPISPGLGSWPAEDCELVASHGEYVSVYGDEYVSVYDDVSPDEPSSDKPEWMLGFEDFERDEGLVTDDEDIPF